MDSIVLLALSAATVAKTATDLVRMGADLPRWASPLLAVVFGTATVFLLQAANSVAFAPPVIAASILAGILAGGSAVGITELQKQSTLVRSERERLL